MAYRFTNTEKWQDAWFVSLKPYEKLLFNYLCDNCDIAGFIELVPENWCAPIKITLIQIKGALEGLQRGLIYSENGEAIFLRNFLKHQKNLPLIPEKNPAHRGIIARFKLYSYKFNIQDITEFIEGASKGLQSPLGNGNGNGNGKGSGKESLQIFKKPTLEEVKNYCLERKNSVDPQKWIDHYTSNGFKVGKNPMKDWQAAIRTWESNSKIIAQTKPTKQNINDLWNRQ